MEDEPTPFLGVASATGSDDPGSETTLSRGRFAPGTMLAGRYRIVDRIGRGGMGEVYRAEDLRLGEPVALKFLPSRLGQDGAALARLHQEVRTARRVSHPNVVRVHDIGEAGGETFLSMELVSGEDLSSLINRIGRLPEEKGIAIARQLCAGLSAAHEKGVLHRDLKPSNVMVDGDGNVRISDFGLAAFASAQREGELAGTPAYMAPEQLRGEKLTVASEVYSLGLLLYEVFSGERLYAQRTLTELAKAHQTDLEFSSARIANLEPVVVRLLERCLALDPAHRPSSAMAVAAALPGGDPMIAALEAGETPSPAMVANANVEGTLSPLTAYSVSVLGALALMAVIFFRTATSPFVVGDTQLRPEVLDHQGMLYLEATGGAPLVEGKGLYWVQQNYWDFSERFLRDLPAKGTAGVPLVSYTFRAAEEPIAPMRRWGQAVNWWDPPVHEPGTGLVEMDGRGRLLRLLRIPSADAALEAEAEVPEWSWWFEASGLDSAAFRSTDPQVVPPTWSDRRFSWEGPAESSSPALMRIDAAARGSQVVQWQLRNATSSKTIRGSTAMRAGLAVFLLMLAGGGLLAWRNARSGRTDQRGALVTATLGGFLWVLDSLVSSGRTLMAGGVGLVLQAMALGLLVGVALGAAYLALEPYLRRVLPHTLVSWNRLLRGRIADPLLARDLLLGCCGGILVSLVSGAQGYYQGWLDLGVPHGAPALWGLASTLANLVHPMSVTMAVGILFLFVAPRIVTGTHWIGNVLGGSLLVLLALVATSGYQIPVFALVLIGLARWVGLAGLFGFGLTMSNLSLVPVVWLPSSWWGPRSLIGPLVLLLLLAWSARTTARRPSVREAA